MRCNMGPVGRAVMARIRPRMINRLNRRELNG
jgi:hypothetical protein